MDKNGRFALQILQSTIFENYITLTECLLRNFNYDKIDSIDEEFKIRGFKLFEVCTKKAETFIFTSRNNIRTKLRINLIIFYIII